MKWKTSNAPAEQAQGWFIPAEAQATPALLSSVGTSTGSQQKKINNQAVLTKKWKRIKKALI